MSVDAVVLRHGHGRGASASPKPAAPPIGADKPDPQPPHVPSSARTPPVSTGNRVAQFIFMTAMCCVLYQLVIDEDELPAVSPTPREQQSEEDGPAPAAAYRRETTRHMTSSECTCFLACLGLFGLLRHNNNNKSKLEARQEEEDAELARALELSRKEMLRHRGRTTETAPGTAAAENAVASWSIASLPLELAHRVLLFLTPRELVMCPVVCKAWEQLTGDAAELLWRLVFERDFGERGDRFRVVFPIDCWRQFFFQHRLSRAVELARLLQVTENRKCVVIENEVYDVTSFIESHPGGPHVIGDVVGTDATDMWEQFQHSAEAKEMMKQFIVHDDVLARGSDDANSEMRGNLQQVVTRWRRISWCLSHSHCFGSMADTFALWMYRFHSRSLRKKQQRPA